MSARWFLARRLVIVAIVAVLSGPMELVAVAQQSAPQTAAQNPPAEPATTQDTSIPDSPGAVRSQSEQGNSASTSTSSSGNQSAPAKPLGTAAAQPVTPTGVAASQPAGAAIAPAKQRRTRSLLIKVGAIVGGGVALGTIFALSNATSSKPPGSH